MNAIRAALTIAAKDLRQRFRDRSALVLGFVAPLGIAALMNLAFAGTETFHTSLGVVDADRSALSGQVVSVLRSPDLADIVTVEPFATRAAAAKAVDDGTTGAAVVVPSGFGAAAERGAAADLDVLTSVDASLAGEVARSIAGAFTARLNAARLSAAAAVAAGAPVEEAGAIAAAAIDDVPAEVTVDRPLGAKPLKSIAYFAPGMAMFFVLFAIGFTVRGFFAERKEGTLDRMAAAPIPPAAILGGKALSVFVYALASLTSMTLLAGPLLGASWGSPAGVALLCLGMSCAVVALAALVMTVARTERQGDTLASVATFTLAMLGGNFVFLGGAPAALRRMTTLTPNGWALRGFTDLSTGVATGAAVTRPLLAMAVFVLVVGGAAAALGRRAVIR